MDITEQRKNSRRANEGRDASGDTDRQFHAEFLDNEFEKQLTAQMIIDGVLTEDSFPEGVPDDILVEVRKLRRI